MAKLIWGSVGERRFEAGVDRGVLFPNSGPGVPWNGLVSVEESPDGGESRPYYVDGFKYLNISASEEFAGTISAYSAPPEFGRCDGTLEIHNGLFATQQPRHSFGFSYRTKIGNDVEGVDHGYKIHLVYNALAGSSQRQNTTLSDSSEPSELSWEITTRPPLDQIGKPTAHFVVDSTKANPITLAYLEHLIYGGAISEPRLPTPSELYTLFEWSVEDINIPVNLIGEWTTPNIVVSNLFTNPSFEAGAGTVEVRRNFFDPSTINNLGVSTAGTVVQSPSYRSLVLPVTPGQVYSFRRVAPLTPRFRVVFTAAQPTVGEPWFGGTGSTSLYDGVEVVNGITVPDLATHMLVYLSQTPEEIPGLLIEKTELAGPFFAPGMPSPDSDLTPSWVGAPNASQSILTGVGVAGIVNASGCVAIRSSQWSKSGNYSIRLIPTLPLGTTPISSYATLTIPVGSVRDSGTVIVTGRQSAALTGSLRDYRGTPYLVAPRKNSDTQMPNAAGEMEHRIQWDVPLTNAGFLMPHGGLVGSGDVWYDCVGIFEGTYDGPWFDGNSPNARWVGGVDSSVSQIDRPETYPPITNNGDAYIINGYIWILVNGTWTNHGLAPEI